MAAQSGQPADRSRRRAIWVAALVVIVAGIFLASPVSTATPTRVASAGTAWVNISATASFQFTPSSVSVPPGVLIKFAVTQLASVAHTFTLSSVVNYTIPSASNSSQLNAFFVAHPPLLNLSLGSTPGGVYYANLSAPAQGTYEFVCTQPGHFQSGMYGFLSVQPPSNGSTGTSTNTLLLYGGIAAAAILVILVVVLLARRARKPPTPPPESPAAPPPSAPPPASP